MTFLASTALTFSMSVNSFFGSVPGAVDFPESEFDILLERS